MALKLLNPFSFPFPSPHLPNLSSSLLKPPKTLIPISFSSSSTPPLSPIFLPHLDPPHPKTLAIEEEEDELVADLHVEEEEEDEEEEDSDPFLTFFNRRRIAPVDDPKREGRPSLQRNRRSSWHLADPGEVEDPSSSSSASTLALESAPELSDSAAAPDDGVVGEIMRLARTLPENSTLGECLGSYEGRVGEGECVELMQRLGEEGLVWECLYLFEWMGLQEPPLVTPRTCSIIFPALGHAGLGEKLRVLFENLPRGRQFRDVRVYNAAISGLASCGR